VRGFTFDISSGAMESLELDSFGLLIVPSSLVIELENKSCFAYTPAEYYPAAVSIPHLLSFPGKHILFICRRRVGYSL